KQRGALIAREIEEINKQVQSAQINALNLDALADDVDQPMADIPTPVTLQELERVLSESVALGERLKPHPKFPRAHLLDWHGDWHEVTFEPKLFDEHPNTLTLLSYGSQLLT